MLCAISRQSWPFLATLSTCFRSIATAIQLDTSNQQSIIDAAGTASYGMMKWYNANQTGGVPGNLPDPYYWWEAGAMMMCLIDYWSATGDSTYNKQVVEAMVHQRGPQGDFMTPNQTKTTGNDDQSFWGFAALEAAELKFDPPPPGEPSWVSLAQGVFNTQVPRWDPTTCGGGLRWQVFPFNVGYNYKNSISNGCFFALAARLARYTGNDTYADWAVKAWDWSKSIGLLDDRYSVFDGADDTLNCSQINHLTFSYNHGVYLSGAAAMWDRTHDPMWKTRVDGLIQGMDIFFKDGVMQEIACEPARNCNHDMRSFKAYASRWLAVTTQLCPWTTGKIMPWLRASAQAAAAQCSGGNDGKTCGLAWVQRGQYDGITGPGEQMAAMSVFVANLVGKAPAPVTLKTGATSKSDPNAGGTGNAEIAADEPATTGDKVGAAALTILVLIPIVGGSIWAVL